MAVISILIITFSEVAGFILNQRFFHLKNFSGLLLGLIALILVGKIIFEIAGRSSSVFAYLVQEFLVIMRLIVIVEIIMLTITTMSSL
jgi:hypothetical protein